MPRLYLQQRLLIICVQAQTDFDEEPWVRRAGSKGSERLEVLSTPMFPSGWIMTGCMPLVLANRQALLRLLR